LLTFGLLGAGYWWLVLSTLIVSMIYSVRAGIMTVIAVTIVLLVIATGFFSGVLNMPHDPQADGVSGVTLASMLLTTVATPFIVFQAIAAYQKTTLALLKEVEQQRDHIMQLANHDSLTGLPLMSLAMERLARVINNATRTKTKVAMLFIDLDGFKSVNDTAGHEAGDFVLRTIAFRIARSIRLSDTAARIGGDEFIVILGGLPDERIATEIAQRIINVVSRPIEYSNRQVRVGASIGIGLFPDHATDGQALRRAADAAMYTAKRRGKNSFTFAENVQLQAVMQAQRASGTSSQLGAAGG
jgi:diguanylate cyclase (GGDEF)-like protein